MEKSNQKLLALVVIIVIAFASFMYLGGYFNTSKTGTSKTSGNGASSTNAATITVTYTDGSKQTFSSAQSASILKSESLVNGGKTASSINTNLDIVPVYTGTVSSYTINSGTFFVEIAVGTVTSWAQAQSSSTTILDVVGDVAVQPVSPLPTFPASGGSVIVCSSTASGNQVPFTGPLYQQGQTYTLIDEISGFSISGTFNDGSTFGPVSAGIATCFWTFQYQSSDTFTSVSVNFALSSS